MNAQPMGELMRVVEFYNKDAIDQVPTIKAQGDEGSLLAPLRRMIEAGRVYVEADPAPPTDAEKAKVADWVRPRFVNLAQTAPAEIRDIWGRM